MHLADTAPFMNASILMVGHMLVLGSMCFTSMPALSLTLCIQHSCIYMAVCMAHFLVCAAATLVVMLAGNPAAVTWAGQSACVWRSPA